MLTKENFRPFAKLRKEKISLPDMGGEVFVRELSAGEFLAFGERSGNSNSIAEKAELVLWMFCQSIIDEQGNRLFADDESQLVGQSLTKGDFEILRSAIFRLNGMDGEPEKKSETP